ncbi:MAG: hypothetical protein HC879_05980 [Leptolyngbyaceae cyanobacterium SL_5_9]|nr:hypothetical protein [Leptolyngbyaceae cyanobacterium SL_5_9]
MSKKNPEMAELNGYIPKELKVKFKTLCAAQDRSMSDVLVEIITEWINQQEDDEATSNTAQR